MKGDINSNFTVAGDKIYVYTTEWVRVRAIRRMLKRKKRHMKQKTRKKQLTESPVAATEDAVMDGDEQSDSTDGTKCHL